MSQKQIKVRLLDKDWTVKFSRSLSPNDSAHADPKGRVIRLDASLKGRDLLEAFIHECLHVLDWSKDEEWVSLAGEQLADALEKLDSVVDIL